MSGKRKSFPLSLPAGITAALDSPPPPVEPATGAASKTYIRLLSAFSGFGFFRVSPLGHHGPRKKTHIAVNKIESNNDKIYNCVALKKLSKEVSK